MLIPDVAVLDVADLLRRDRQHQVGSVRHRLVQRGARARNHVRLPHADARGGGVGQHLGARARASDQIAKAVQRYVQGDQVTVLAKEYKA